MYVKVGILLICGKHFHDCIISLRWEVFVHKTSLTLPLFIEVSLPSQENEQSCIFVLWASIFPLSMFRQCSIFCSHLKQFSTKKTMTYGIRNPGSDLG